MENYIDIQFARDHNLQHQSITPRPVFNVDGSPNKAAAIKHKVFFTISFSGQPMKIEVYATVLDRNPIILGLSWFKRFNPVIDWVTGKMPFCWDQLLRAIKTLASNIPDYLNAFLSVFNKSTAEQLPERKPWDYAINLEANFKPQQGKVYLLSPAKLKELDTFIEENLRKGYIHPSKSPMASPFFFVNKKSGDLRPCQDYRKLNDATIKNAYPIPRVEDLLDRVASAKPTMFTKLDLHTGYNNVRIKEGDEWKGAFITP
ncbi:uncharacterized protein FIBRA_09572 [Fibroporia radiculosa]|uniref:Reverse transcriptase domain-containing protein n=1 Tax=Fibroporia radiculosa TaxID=599839 RepID=J7RI31_9APHY|nr:uncharacterized protein FIBRA_09572 [Fibroporia radiculosa]CCM07227.1 predicted protein [Fibroporia radiculosa]